MTIDLRAERRNRGLLLRDVATEFEVSTPLISMIERGERRPSPPLAKKFADKYGCEIEDIWPDFNLREAA